MKVTEVMGLPVCKRLYRKELWGFWWTQRSLAAWLRAFSTQLSAFQLQLNRELGEEYQDDLLERSESYDATRQELKADN